MNWTLPPELENTLAEFYKGPEPDRNFVSRLELELRHRFSDVPKTPSLRWRHRKESMRNLRLHPVFAVLLAIVALLLISGVVYAIGRLTGFIPGFGFTSGDVYIIDRPVEQRQNGVLIQVENAVYDENGFWLKLSIQAPQGQDDYPQIYTVSKSGEKFQAGHGSAVSSEPGIWHMIYTFPKLNSPNQPVTLLLENIGGQAIQFNLMLRPIHNDEVLPTLPGGTLPIAGEAKDGMALELESVAMSRDRTVLQVSLRFDDPTISLAEAWEVTMKDADGRIYPLLDITPMTMDASRTRIYQASPMQGNETLTLDVTGFPADGNLSALWDLSANPATFRFDPGNNPQIGQVWTVDKTLQVGQFSVHLMNAYMASSTELIFEFESESNVTGVMLSSPMASGASGGEPVQNGNLSAIMLFKSMPNEPFEIQIRSVYHTISGPWQVEWQVPAASVLDFPTMVPAASPTPLVLPTTVSKDPRLLEVQTLVQKFDQSVIHGPAWIHVVYENTADNLPAGQTYPPPYYQDEEWYEIGANGWVLRNLSTHQDATGNILQRAASIGTKGVNLTSGDVFENPLYRLSFDSLTQDMDAALQRNQSVTREVTSCEDGSACLLITVLEHFPQPIQNPGAPAAFYGHGLRVWINVESGLQVKRESFWSLKENEELVDFTQRVLLIENVDVPPDDVLNILAGIILP